MPASLVPSAGIPSPIRRIGVFASGFRAEMGEFATLLSWGAEGWLDDIAFGVLVTAVGLGTRRALSENSLTTPPIKS